MFEKLVECNAAEADFRSRKKFFFVSSVIVGILFITAVVASIYAADYGLNVDSLELSELIAPIAPTEAIEPEPQPQRQTTAAASSDSTQTTRRDLIASTNDPSRVPTGVSTERNTSLSIPDGGKFILSSRDSNGGSPTGQGDGQPGAQGGPSSSAVPAALADSEPEKAPPPVKKVTKPPTQTKGVINGEAKYLPKPTYPPAAVALQVSGAVNVQVTIDESGKVISARAVSGNPLLRQAAENAARRATFSTTYLSEVPVKVTGMIVYNFTRQ